MAEIHYGATLTDFLAAAVARFPQRPATYFAGQTLTYGELDAQVAAAAGGVCRAFFVRSATFRRALICGPCVLL